MTEETKEDVTQQLTIRLTAEIIKQLDELGKRKYRTNGKGDRSRVIRLLIEDGMREEMET